MPYDIAVIDKVLYLIAIMELQYWDIYLCQKETIASGYI